MLAALVDIKIRVPKFRNSSFPKQLRKHDESNASQLQHDCKYLDISLHTVRSVYFYLCEACMQDFLVVDTVALTWRLLPFPSSSTTYLAYPSSPVALRSFKPIVFYTDAICKQNTVNSKTSLVRSANESEILVKMGSTKPPTEGGGKRKSSRTAAASNNQHDIRSANVQNTSIEIQSNTGSTPAASSSRSAKDLNSPLSSEPTSTPAPTQSSSSGRVTVPPRERLPRFRT